MLLNKQIMNTEKKPLENENEPSCLGAVSGSIFDVSEEEMTQNCMMASESSFKKEWSILHTAKCMYKLKNIPNIEGFELIAVFEDNSTLKTKVSKNKNGQYHIVDFNKMIGWYSVSEYYR